MVRIRMKRMGRRHKPFYRINAVEKRTQRDGVVIEELGWYNPLEKDAAKAVNLKEDRIKHWISLGAQPSDTVRDMLAKRGLVDVEAWKKDREARKQRRMKARAKPAAAAESAE